MVSTTRVCFAKSVLLLPFFFFFLATNYNTGLTLSLSGFEFVCSDVLMIQDGIGVKMP